MPDVLSVPARRIPVNKTGSEALRDKLANRVAVPLFDSNNRPRSNAEWQAWWSAFGFGPERIDELATRFGVTVQEQQVADIPCFLFTPIDLDDAKARRLLINIHGGGFVLNAGKGGTDEALFMASVSRCRVLAIDYRTPPDFPYPAALDDVVAVWCELIGVNDPQKMAIFGTSAGGAIILSLIQHARRENIPLPAAIAPGTPWSDLSPTGDSYHIFADIDPMSYDGLLEFMAADYAGGLDLEDSRVSPIYGEFDGFPPAILTSGTRDLFLSNTVRVYEKLRRAKVEAKLQVFEGQEHGAYLDPALPEMMLAFSEISEFFDQHLQS